MKETPKKPTILWDIGTAYDFFVSLIVLHDPAEFGLRSAWASGMRQRIPAVDREILEAFQGALTGSPPVDWIYSLPEPKDGATVLEVARKADPLGRMKFLLGLPETESTLEGIFEHVFKRGDWNETDLEVLKEHYTEIKDKSVTTKYLTDKLDIWARADEFSEGIMHALQAYHEVFFAEEERRIMPALKTALVKAQELSQQLDLPDLLEELSRGVRYEDDRFQGVDALILAPSYWVSPFILTRFAQTSMILFGARPESDSLVPGELVPASLMASLNALSDPTRLRILRYLSSESLTPTQLATRLRLRTPTVVHHLKALRKAGLVIVISGHQKKEVHYRTRAERLITTCEILEQFVKGKEE